MSRIFLLAFAISFLGPTTECAVLREPQIKGAVIIPTFEDFLKTSFEFLYRDDLRGLLDYIEKLPDWKNLILWLQSTNPEAVKAIECLLFGFCPNGGVVIDPGQVQIIMGYITRQDWNGLSAYVCSQPNLEVVVMWIKINYPNAYLAIADKIKDC